LLPPNLLKGNRSSGNVIPFRTGGPLTAASFVFFKKKKKETQKKMAAAAAAEKEKWIKPWAVLSIQLRGKITDRAAGWADGNKRWSHQRGKKIIIPAPPQEKEKKNLIYFPPAAYIFFVVASFFSSILFLFSFGRVSYFSR
jgi:hypothetical protein